jgi:nucleoside-diphosphate-sugar epimerase
MPTILITGGCGYLGSQLIRDLAKDKRLAGPTIRILDNLQRGHYSALMALPQDGKFQFVEGDLLDPAVTRCALQDVDTVIHLAAIVRTPLSFENPTWLEQVNLWGTTHLLEACLKAKVSRFIFASSMAVYGPGGPFAETDRCCPQGAYAQSKLQAEKAVLAAAQRGLQTTVLRLGTIYGLAPVTRFDAVANRLVYLAGVGRSLTVYGNGQQRRPLIHVRDACEAIAFSLTQPDLTIGRVLNTIGQNVAVLELVEAIRQLKPDLSVHFTEQDIRTHLSFEASNAEFVGLGWEPQLTIHQGLAELLEQYRGLTAMPTQLLEFD